MEDNLMNENTNLITSIENVVDLINNSIILFRDFDKELNKLGFYPVDSKKLDVDISNQAIDSKETIFPRFISRTYINKSLSKIILINIQFWHENQPKLQPQLFSSIIVSTTQLLSKSWISEIVFNKLGFNNIRTNGVINEYERSSNHIFKFWCNDLIKFNNLMDVKEECIKIKEIFEKTSL